jgi:hypothetical protein
LNSTLRALEKFQEVQGIELLEWHEEDRTLYVLEPSFLFFLRWGLGKNNGRSLTGVKVINTALLDSVLENLLKSGLAVQPISKKKN